MPKRGRASAKGRFMTAGVLASAALLAFTLFRTASAAPPPTLAVTMDDTAITTGETALVTFTFSASPIGFDNSDVDLSDANGTITTVKPSPDPRVWLATYTPNPGVNDDTNSILVGPAWTDPGGVGPVSETKSANFTVHTSAPAGTGCPPSSVTIAAPNGGETLHAGDGVDVFWTANGCQVVGLRLSLSTDGGATFSQEIATTDAPFSGYYRWTVPDLDAPTARLQAMLIGQGGVVLASDMSDGDLAIVPSASASSSAPSEPSPPAPAPTPPAPAPPPADPGSGGTPTTDGGTSGGGTPAPTPPPSSGGTGGTVSPPTSPSATTSPKPASVPSPAPAPAAKTFPGPMAPPMPNVPAPLDQQPVNTPMTNADQNQALTLDHVQTAVETASEFAPSSMEMVFSFALGALSMLALLLGVQKAMRDRKNAGTQPCGKCKGSGREQAKKKLEKCDDCDGTGFVDDEEEQSVECAHCEGEGEDPCHECKGTGKDKAGAECKACKGGGKTLEDPEDEDSEVAECEICRGEGEVSATIKKKVKCETCDGTGKV